MFFLLQSNGEKKKKPYKAEDLVFPIAIWQSVLIPLNLFSLFVIQDWFYQLYTSPEVIGESNKIKTSEKSLNIVWAQQCGGVCRAAWNSKLITLSYIIELKIVF